MNFNEQITPIEARQLLEVVTPLARNCVFTKLDFMRIFKICMDSIDRQEHKQEE